MVSPDNIERMESELTKLQRKLRSGMMTPVEMEKALTKIQTYRDVLGVFGYRVSFGLKGEAMIERIRK